MKSRKKSIFMSILVCTLLFEGSLYAETINGPSADDIFGGGSVITEKPIKKAESSAPVKTIAVSSANTSSSKFVKEKSQKVKNKFQLFLEKIKKQAGKFVGSAKQGFAKIVDKFKGKGKDFVVHAYEIPGHENKSLVCQGITYMQDEILPASQQKTGSPAPYTILSYYPKKPDESGLTSQLVVFDENGEAVCRFDLLTSSGKPYTGHAGGIALAGKYLWVASGCRLYGFDANEILAFVKAGTEGDSGAVSDYLPSGLDIPHKKIKAVKNFNADSKAGYVSFDGTYIWVGDFVKSSESKYAAVPHHTENEMGKKTWISGYKTDDDGMPVSDTVYEYKIANGSVKKGTKPDAVIVCRECVQGMAVCDKYIALSISFGAANGKLAFYKSPLGSDGEEMTYQDVSGNSYSVPVYELADGKNYVTTQKVAAGCEDLSYDGTYLYTTFEGGSPNYKRRWSLVPGVKIDNRFYKIDIDKIIK